MDDLDKFKAVFISKYIDNGYRYFYNYLLAYCAKKIVLIKDTEYKGIYPHLEMLKYYETSLKIYRRDGDENLFKLAKLFRKVAHMIYRAMLRENLIQHNHKFLTEVSNGCN